MISTTIINAIFMPITMIIIISTIINMFFGMMILNCNGVEGPSKQAAFHAALDIHKRDIVLVCESQLCNSMCNYEFFPNNYIVFRKDCNVSGVWAFVAASDRVISHEIPN